MATKKRRPIPSMQGLSQEAYAWIQELQKQSDRGAIIVAGAFLEDALASLLRAFLIDVDAIERELFRYPQPLSSFAAKIDVAYYLGLIDANLRADLHLLRELRNQAAHYREQFDFTSPGVEAACKKFTVSAGLLKLPTPGMEAVSLSVSACFTLAAALLLQEIRNASRRVKQLSEKPGFRRGLRC